MRKSTKIALLVSLFVLVGLPVMFAIISLYTGNWKFFINSIPPSVSAGFSGLVITILHIKKDQLSK